ncbi:MAG: UbiD family decarboxylase [Deltaproteobacteria bacterium]|jgi:2,5-furandicarboxylate decarboxylase 1|nr:UbiD family decarboxylase [Deltaproteobacteria bacterium]
MDFTLRGWLSELERLGRLKTVSRQVSPVHEIAAVTLKAGPDVAIMFNNVTGYDVPVVTGLAGSRPAMAASLGLGVREMLNRFNQALNSPVPCQVEASGHQEVKSRVYRGEAVDLEKILPACVHHEFDSGKYLTAAMLITKDPETGVRNMAIHRHELHGGNKLGALLLPRHTANIFNRAEALDKPLEVALIIGAHPVVLLASQATTRLGVDELEIAGGLMGQPLKLVKCETVDLEVPVESEFVLEGRILPNVRHDEGPFGEYPRTYGPQSRRHFLEIGCVTHREKPIYHTITPATLEHLLLGAIPREATMLQLIKQAVPTTLAVHLTPSGGCRYHCVIQIDKQNEGEAKNAIFAALASSAEIKHVVVVDKDIDPFDLADVEWAISTRLQASKDAFIVAGAMGNKLDPSANDGLGDKLGLDATTPSDPQARQRFQKIRVPGVENVNLDDYFD